MGSVTAWWCGGYLVGDSISMSMKGEAQIMTYAQGKYSIVLVH